MDFVGLFGIAVGLSMDAFAVAVCKGLGMRRINVRHALVIALFFGLFQAAMPLIGWALGTQFEPLISPIDHWIAFVLLVVIGGKMLWESFRSRGCTECDDNLTTIEQKLDLRELVMLSIATSIDALAAGITFAFLRVEIVSAASLIGVTTFMLSFLGVGIGNRFGSRFERPATMAGGVVLILIGTKILLEHLGILSF